MYTAAEVRVIHEIIKGLPLVEIAKNIGCAVKTVKKHIQRINKKSKTRSKGDFISLYYRACLRSKNFDRDFYEPSAAAIERLISDARSEILPIGKAS